MPSLQEIAKKAYWYGAFAFFSFQLVVTTIVLLWVSFGIINGTHEANNSYVTLQEYQLILTCAILHSFVFVFRPLSELGYKSDAVRYSGEFLYFSCWVSGMVCGFVGYVRLDYAILGAFPNVSTRTDTASQQLYASILGIVGCSFSCACLVAAIIGSTYFSYARKWKKGANFVNSAPTRVEVDAR